MKGLLAIVLLTIINVFELLLMLRTSIIPVELAILAVSLITVLLAVITINKKGFTSLIRMLAIINILNSVYLFTKFGIIIFIPFILSLVVFWLAHQPKKHEYQQKLEQYMQQLPVRQVEKTYSPGKYIASKQGAVFHSPTCMWAKKIPQANRVWFDSTQQAQSKGYKKHNCI
ncbi:MAG: hypothetical protein ABIG95_01680 [Candidatus Woesearchaeota archaeon]